MRHANPHFNGTLKRAEVFQLLSLRAGQRVQLHGVSAQLVCLVRERGIAFAIRRVARVQKAHARSGLLEDAVRHLLHCFLLQTQIGHQRSVAHTGLLQPVAREYACGQDQCDGHSKARAKPGTNGGQDSHWPTLATTTGLLTASCFSSKAMGPATPFIADSPPARPMDSI